MTLPFKSLALITYFQLEKRASLLESQDKQECLAVLALTSKIDSILEQNKKDTEKFSEKLSSMKASIEKVNLEKKEWENKAQKMTQECNSVSSFSVFTFLILLYTDLDKDFQIQKAKFEVQQELKSVQSKLKREETARKREETARKREEQTRKSVEEEHANLKATLGKLINPHNTSKQDKNKIFNYHCHIFHIPSHSST